ncbi:flagellar motor switch phosphatase FliY [Aminivibrio sp.]|jgi:flagellar motor switch protein FliN/FliY|uniref:flagellar motor switch phosphatase FliY n=1 Tax=Aminivibrio sp. TaxID=1872489 RepID=UPI001A637FE7|nr:flagellar motor switch phosphatase FliY [Aminivibrio sp.]MBL3538760.1 flagellar motor switch phosphatase FliY [Aminivibrio sp.]MDK2958179.1 flagellar motor switch protein FliN [Synergistaceae bacterium]
MIDELLSQDEINALLSGADFGGDGGAGKDTGGIPPERQGILDDIAGIFSASVSSVYGMLAGKEVTSVVRETAVLSQRDFISRPEGAAFAFRATCGGLNDAPLVLVITERGALTLADLMMGGEGKELPDEAGELYLNAAQEGLSQVVGAAFTGVSGMLGGKRLIPENISSALEPEEWLPFPTRSPEDQTWTVSASVSIEGLGDFPLWVLLPLDMATALADEVRELVAGKEKKEAPAADRTPSSGPKQPQGAPRAETAAPEAEHPSFGNVYDQSSVDVRPAEFVPLLQKPGTGYGNSRIDLVADIPVRVTVELGRTRKNISDILNMTPGSVIELDKMAGEPVDILVNGKLVAKGEVVVIDENFGVRITEIVSSAGRVHSL